MKQVALSVDVTKLELIELNVTSGQEVQKGTVLARIETDSLERAVEQAKADLLSAEEALQREVALANPGVGAVGSEHPPLVSLRMVKSDQV